MSVFSQGTFNWDTKRLKITENTENLGPNMELCSCSRLWYWLHRRDVQSCTENTFSLKFCAVLWGDVCGPVGRAGKHRHGRNSDSAPALPLTPSKPQTLCCSSKLDKMLTPERSNNLTEQTFGMLEILRDETL